MQSASPSNFNFEDLTLWRTKLPEVNFAVLPARSTRPNPVASNDRLYVSVFSPGAVCALELDRGKLIWRTKLPGLGGASVCLHEGKLFAKTSNVLFALDPDSGKPIWSFCPYGTEGESIYSYPSAEGDRVYIGDRGGYLHCLNCNTGSTIWRRSTSQARNADVNSTPVLKNGLVIVSTNARRIAAYDARSGELAWKQKLDGTSIFGPLSEGDSIFAVSNSLYQLEVNTGEIQQRFSWKNEKVLAAEVTPQSIVVLFWPRLWTRKKQQQPKLYKLTLVERNSGLQRSLTLGGYCPCFRYVRIKRLLYLSHLSGLDLIRPREGTVFRQIKTTSDTRGGIALVDVSEDAIYVLTGDGYTYSLRHPT